MVTMRGMLECHMQVYELACLTVLVRLLFSSTSESLLWRHHYQTCTDINMFPCGERSTCCSSSGYTWSQVVSFNWIMAMIGWPTFTILEHGKKSKICLAIIFTDPRGWIRTLWKCVKVKISVLSIHGMVTMRGMLECHMQDIIIKLVQIQRCSHVAKGPLAVHQLGIVGAKWYLSTG